MDTCLPPIMTVDKYPAMHVEIGECECGIGTVATTLPDGFPLQWSLLSCMDPEFVMYSSSGSTETRPKDWQHVCALSVILRQLQISSSVLLEIVVSDDIFNTHYRALLHVSHTWYETSRSQFVEVGILVYSILEWINYWLLIWLQYYTVSYYLQLNRTLRRPFRHRSKSWFFRLDWSFVVSVFDSANCRVECCTIEVTELVAAQVATV